jgi:hypothetical protein
MTYVVVSFVGNFVQDIGEVPMQGFVNSTEASEFKAGETAATDEKPAEIDSIADRKRREQMLQHYQR